MGTFLTNSSLVILVFFSLPLFARDNRVIRAQGALVHGNAQQAYLYLKNRKDHDLGGYAQAAQDYARQAANAQARGNEWRANLYIRRAENQLQYAEAYAPNRFRNDPYTYRSYSNPYNGYYNGYSNPYGGGHRDQYSYSNFGDGHRNQSGNFNDIYNSYSPAYSNPYGGGHQNQYVSHSYGNFNDMYNSYSSADFFNR